MFLTKWSEYGEPNSVIAKDIQLNQKETKYQKVVCGFQTNICDVKVHDWSRCCVSDVSKWEKGGESKSHAIEHQLCPLICLTICISSNVNLQLTLKIVE